LAVNDEYLRFRLFNFDPKGAHAKNRVHAIDASRKTAKDTDPIGKGSNHDGAVRNALVAGNIYFRLDPRRTFNSKINHGVKGPRLPASRESEEKNPKLRANVQRDTREQRRIQLRLRGDVKATKTNSC